MCRYADVIFGIDAEVILPPVHDIADCDLVVEESVGHCGPRAFGGVQFGHRVVEAVITLLIRRRFPRHRHCAGHVLLQLHQTRRLRIIWKYNQFLLAAGPSVNILEIDVARSSKSNL